MTKRDWAILSCRILAMFLFIEGVSMLVQALGWLGVTFWGPWTLVKEYREIGLGAWVITLQPLLMVISACLVWWVAPNLARRLVGEEPHPGHPAPAAPGGLDQRGAMEVAFVVLGVYLLTKGLSHLVPGVFGMIWDVRDGLDWRPQLGGLLEPGVLVILGLCLVAGGRGIASLVTGLRSVGTQAADAQGSEMTGQVARRRLAMVALLLVVGLLILAALALGTWVAKHIVIVPF